MRIFFDDGSIWTVEDSLIADDRAKYYDEIDDTVTYQEEYDYAMQNKDELYDWMKNNMNWEDLNPTMVDPPRPVDHKELYAEGRCEIQW